MPSVTCPACFALMRSVPLQSQRSFVTCPSCGHRFLASGDVGATPQPIKVQDTHAIPAQELASLLADVPAGEPAPEEADDPTRESTRREEVPVPVRAKARLVVVATRKALPLEKFQFVIGREGADLALDDPTISRRHAIVENHSDRFLLKDLGSTNGTFINGKKITVEFLQAGDIVQAGKVKLRFERL